MTACETLTWIAFHNPISADISADLQRNVYQLSRLWPVQSIALCGHKYQTPELLICEFLWPNTLDSLLENIIEEIEGYVQPTKEEIDNFCDSTLNAFYEIVAPLPSEQAARMVRSVIEDTRKLISEQGKKSKIVLRRLLADSSGSDLVRDLTADVARVEHVNPLIWEAAAALRRALEAGRVRGTGIVVGERKRTRRLIHPSEWLIGIEPCLDGAAREIDDWKPKIEALLFDTAEILAEWPFDVAKADRTAPTTAVQSEPGLFVNKGGAPTRYDWDAFWIEVALFLSSRGPEHGGRAELQRHMEDWIAREWTHPPDPSTIRRKLARYHKREAARAVQNRA